MLLLTSTYDLKYNGIIMYFIGTYSHMTATQAMSFLTLSPWYDLNNNEIIKVLVHIVILYLNLMLK